MGFLVGLLGTGDEQEPALEQRRESLPVNELIPRKTAKKRG